MSRLTALSSPPPLRAYQTPETVFAALRDHYEQQTAWLLQQFEAYKAQNLTKAVRAYYPKLRVTFTHNTHCLTDSDICYAGYEGIHETSITRPQLFKSYLLEQLENIFSNQACKVEIGLSHTPIPLPFAAIDGLTPGDHFDIGQLVGLRAQFDLPDLMHIDDRIANGEFEQTPDKPHPLSLFTAPRIDFSLQRLRHYCGTNPEHFQRFILFTNYQDYIDDFTNISLKKIAEGAEDCEAFVEPGDYIHQADGEKTGQPAARQPQMPAYHYKRPNRNGVSIINIGVGPSNAKTITDHIAVLRPDAWLMVGHCAGLRRTQKLGDYVLAHAYVRDDNVLDQDLPSWVPVPAVAEIQQSLEAGVAKVSGKNKTELKQIMRTGTVASVDNRNWELLQQQHPNQRLSQSRAIALDMESATIAANGFRMRVPYGTLLCVSDKPLHGELKLPGMANSFYKKQIRQHLQITLAAVEQMRQLDPKRLHSRKLRSFDEPMMR